MSHERGNRRADVFWTDEDRRQYLVLLQEYAARHGLEICEKRGIAEDWRSWLAEPEDESMLGMLRRRTRTGRPAGDPAFVARLKALAGRILAARTVGRPKIGKRP